MKIDSHQHFWVYNQADYGWISDEMAILRNDFLPLQLEKELKTIQFDGSIVVQARQLLEETEWLIKLSDNYPFIKGVVGWLDLCSPEIEQQLKQFATHPKFVGVRHVIHDEADDDFMNRSDFQHGISLLAKYKLTYDLLLFPKHLALASTLVEKFPTQRFVLDHIAKPQIKAQLHEPWAADIQRLAQNENVYCKLSGMVTEANWQNWTVADFTFYLDTVFQAFGTERIMIGSDWPVCTVGGSYKQIMELVINYISQFDDKIQNKILGENCNAFYLNNMTL